MEQKPTKMFSVTTTLEHGYPAAFSILDQKVAEKIRRDTGSIKIVDWEDKVYPPISPGSRMPDLQQTVTRVVVYEPL